MKAKELRNLGVADLKQKEKSLREEYFNLRFRKATRQLENTAELRKVRGDIAKVLTVISEKERASA